MTADGVSDVTILDLDNITVEMAYATGVAMGMVKEIEISGHTDSEGPEEFNQKLSEGRAKAVVDYLVEKGIENIRLSYIGYGENKPIDTNNTDIGRAQNRRVEFKLKKK